MHVFDMCDVTGQNQALVVSCQKSSLKYFIGKIILFVQFNIFAQNYSEGGYF